MKVAHCGSLIVLALALPVFAAQPLRAAPAQSEQSPDALAAAARSAREQRKNQPKPAKVWDNDNIPTNGGVDVIGQAASSAEPIPSAKAPATNDKKSTAKAGVASSKKEKSALESQLTSAKENLKSAQTDLDFAQRKYRLDQQDFYQNPNYSSNESGAAALQAEQNQIEAKKQAVESLQETLNDLESKLAKASDAGSSSNDTSAK
jgi:predicted ATP-dependent Lon-type protease